MEHLLENAVIGPVMHLRKELCLGKFNQLIHHHQQGQHCPAAEQNRNILRLHSAVSEPLDGQRLQKANPGGDEEQKPGNKELLEVRPQIGQDSACYGYVFHGIIILCLSGLGYTLYIMKMEALPTGRASIENSELLLFTALYQSNRGLPSSPGSRSNGGIDVDLDICVLLSVSHLLKA